MCTEKNQKFDDMSKDILSGRIWPAIQSCVGNRYRILLGVFAFYSFIMTSTIQSIRLRFDDIKLYASILFTVMTMLNSYNYFRNSSEAWKNENITRTDKLSEWIKRNDIELVFLLVMIALVWGSYFLIKDC
jgi:hypothetical protein